MSTQPAVRGQAFVLRYRLDNAATAQFQGESTAACCHWINNWPAPVGSTQVMASTPHCGALIR